MRRRRPLVLAMNKKEIPIRGDGSEGYRAAAMIPSLAEGFTGRSKVGVRGCIQSGICGTDVTLNQYLLICRAIVAESSDMSMDDEPRGVNTKGYAV